MKRRSLLLIILIVLLPVGLLTWLGVQLARDEQSVTQQRFRSVMEQRLQDVNRLIVTQFEGTERRLQQVTAIDDFDIANLREVVRNEPQVIQVFVLTPDGSLLYPNPGETLNGTEMSFLRQASRMFTDRDLQNAVALAEAAGTRGDFTPAPAAPSEPPGAVSVTVPLVRRADSSVQQLTDSSPQAAEAAQIDVPLTSAEFAPNQSVSDAAGAPTTGAQNNQDNSVSARAASGASVEFNQRSTTADSERGQSPLVEADDASELRVPQLTQQMFAAGSQNEPGFLPAGGWFVWYWDRGMNLIYWQRRPSGHIVGAALERARWIADLISVLPETNRNDAASEIPTAFRVISSAAEHVYGWGPEPLAGAVPYCEIPMAAPLASWRIQCFVSEDQLLAGSGRSAFLSMTTGLTAFAMTLGALAWLLFRDYSRDMREASQQVSFVNQVSHELKTPLTNIRLYAELMERDLEEVPDEQSAEPRRRLDVINAEAQRLSRLIGNVLTFARQQRKTIKLQPSEVRVGDLVRQIASRFGPSLHDHGIVVTVTADDDRTLWLDADVLEQILGNLISNVEKYAASGGVLTIRCTSSPTQTTLDVIDAGPGIPAAQRAEVFRPFARLNNDLRASSGTGIGLSIARDLARLHGGDLVLLNSTQGCWFQARLSSIPGDC